MITANDDHILDWDPGFSSNHNQHILQPARPFQALLPRMRNDHLPPVHGRIQRWRAISSRAQQTLNYLPLRLAYRTPTIYPGKPLTALPPQAVQQLSKYASTEATFVESLWAECLTF